MTTDINTRALVLDIILEITQNQALSHLVIRNVLNKYQYLEKKDRAFIQRLSEGTIERIVELDYILNAVSKTKTDKMKPVIRAILRMGVYQIKYMDHIPNRAACNEAVKLANRRGFKGLSGFVNGVLRNVVRRLDSIVYPDKKTDLPGYLSVRYSMPYWLTERFYKQFPEEAERILSSFLEERSTPIRVNMELVSTATLIHSLEKQGICVVRDKRLPYALHISQYDVLTGLKEFQKRWFQVQDIASMLTTELAGPKTGQFVLDVCAAPGGKAIHTAQRLKGSGMVEARDISEYKVGLLEEAIVHSGLSNIRAKMWDATVSDSSMIGKVDLLIADLPCSGLGVIGKKPDIKYHASEEKIRQLAEIQRKILKTIQQYVKPGGVMLYSTCTLTREENQDNMEWFLRTFTDFTLCEERELLPDNNTDGFYMARLEKKYD